MGGKVLISFCCFCFYFDQIFQIDSNIRSNNSQIGCLLCGAAVFHGGHADWREGVGKGYFPLMQLSDVGTALSLLDHQYIQINFPTEAAFVQCFGIIVNIVGAHTSRRTVALVSNEQQSIHRA